MSGKLLVRATKLVTVPNRAHTVNEKAKIIRIVLFKTYRIGNFQLQKIQAEFLTVQYLKGPTEESMALIQLTIMIRKADLVMESISNGMRFCKSPHIGEVTSE